jgi:hypothetical protein
MSKSIKETKEVVAFIECLGVILAGELQDGFQPLEDVPAALGKLALPENVKKLQDAVQGSGDVVDELKDTSYGEAIEFLFLFLAAVKKIKA